MIPTLAALLAGTPAFAGPDPAAPTADAQASADAIRKPLLDLLNAYEHSPTAAELHALGPAVPDALMALAGDPSVPPTRRARAVTALGHLPGPAARTFLEARLTGDDPLLRRKAAWALATAYGDDSLPALTVAIAHDDAPTREATARALAEIGTPAARALLTERQPLERDPHVLDALRAGSVGAVE